MSWSAHLLQLETTFELLWSYFYAENLNWLIRAQATCTSPLGKY